jgi:hypothetical protein
MKLKHLLAVSAVGFSLLLTPSSAFATGPDNPSPSLFGVGNHTDTDHAPNRQSDMNGQNTGIGRNCDHGKGNGGGYCPATSPQNPPPPPPPPGGGPKG